MRIITIITLLTLASACSDGPTGSATANKIQPTDADIEFARSATPTDEATAKNYQRSCKNCHSIAGVNAPLTGHVADWQARLDARGRDGLLKSTKYGYRAMPAKGLCGGCSDDEFLALIDFMMKPAG